MAFIWITVVRLLELQRRGDSIEEHWGDSSN
jgi:hypothetical protein